MEDIYKEAMRLAKEKEEKVTEEPFSVLMERPDEMAKKLREMKANIYVVGMGGAGTNIVDTIMRLGIAGARCIAINTDVRHLEGAVAHEKLLIGEKITGGLGTGGYPHMGRAAADMDRDKIFGLIGPQPDLVFVVAGMGGGTGTGGASIVADIAREKHAIVVGAVTLPFGVEGEKKMEIALEGVRELKKHAHVVILMSNDKLGKITEDLPLGDAFAIGSYALAVMVKGITEIINKKTFINVDFADVKTVFLTGGGVAAVGIGESNDPRRKIEEAVGMALENQLLEYSPEGAKGALIVVNGGPGLTMKEAIKAVEIIKKKMDKGAIVKIGADVNERMGDKARVILVISGIRSPYFVPGEEVAVAPEILTDIPLPYLQVSRERKEEMVAQQVVAVLGRKNVMRFN